MTHGFEFRQHCRKYVLLLMWTLLAGSAAAQGEYYQQPGKPYWRLFTDYTTRSTLVKFYNADHLQIYEEVIAGKYIKLTKKNRHILDRTLQRLVGNQLIASTVKSTYLVEQKEQLLTEIPPSLLRDELKATKAITAASDKGMRATMHLMNVEGKFKLIYENPQKAKVEVILRNDRNQAIYHQASFADKYIRTFDLLGMPHGEYTLVVKSKGYTFSRQVYLRYGNYAPGLQIVNPAGNQTADLMELHL